MSSLSRHIIKRILCIKLRGIGDVILSTVVLESLQDAYPDAKIDFLTEGPSEPILQGSPFINRVLKLEKSFTGMLRTIFEIRANHYDLVLDFYSNPRTAQITFLSGAKLRAGFPYRGRTYAYNHFGPEERSNMHSADLHLAFLNQLGIPTLRGNLRVQLPEKDVYAAENFLDNSPLLGTGRIAISPSGGWASKKADPEVFVTIAHELLKHFNCKFLIVWGPGDKEDAERIARGIGSEYALLAPPSSFTGMGGLMSLCKAVIANDSGPMHYAAALGIPVLGLFGPTNPALQGPYGEIHETVRYSELDCINCNLLNCPKKHECFLQLPVERVIASFLQLLQKNNIELS